MAYSRLFDIDKGNVIMNPVLLWIPEFKKLWDRDKSKGKETVQKEISYIVFLHSFQSPYQAYSEEDREPKIINDFFKGVKNWKPDEAIKAAETKYLELQDSVVLRLFNSTKLALEAINLHFKALYEKTKSGEGEVDIDKLVKNAERLGNLVQSLEKLKVQVQKEQLESASVRGGQSIGAFEI